MIVHEGLLPVDHKSMNGNEEGKVFLSLFQPYHPWLLG